MEKYTCYWIEPFKMVIDILDSEKWEDYLIRTLFFIVNFLLLGIPKVVISAIMSKKLGLKFKLKPCRNMFTMIGNSINKMLMGDFSGFGFD